MIIEGLRIKLLFCLTVFLSVFLLFGSGVSALEPLSDVRLTGYIGVDFDSKKSDGLLSGFLVEIEGTDYKAVTDSNGYFQIAGIHNAGSIIISKNGYLKRTITGIAFSSDTVISSSDCPVTIWAGDIVVDNVINMADIVQLAASFNSIKGQSRYVTYCDFNMDGAVNLTDIMIAARHFGLGSKKYPDLKPVVSSATPVTTPVYSPTPEVFNERNIVTKLVVSADQNVINNDGVDTAKITPVFYNKYDEKIDNPGIDMYYFINGVPSLDGEFKSVKAGKYDIYAQAGCIKSNLLTITVAPRYKVSVSVDRDTILDDGKDKAVLKTEILDKNGCVVTPNEAIEYNIKGNDTEYKTTNNEFISEKEDFYYVDVEYGGYSSKTLYIRSEGYLRAELSVSKSQVICNGTDLAAFSVRTFDKFNKDRPSNRNVTYYVNNTKIEGSTFIPPAAGIYSVYAMVGEIKSNILEFTAVPVPLKADAGKQKYTIKTASVKLDGRGSTCQSSRTLTYKWRFLQRPTGSNAVLNNANSAQPDFIADTEGDYVVGLVVGDGFSTSDEETVLIKAKGFASTIDDIVIPEDGSYIGDYKFTDMIPLVDGWVFAGDTKQNKVSLLNVITGEKGVEYKLEDRPFRMVFDFENEILYTSLFNTNKIAQIDLKKNDMRYIETTGIAGMVLDEKGYLIYLGDNKISVVDLKDFSIVSSLEHLDNVYLRAYDWVENDLLIGSSYSEDVLLYHFDETTKNVSFVSLYKSPAGKNKIFDLRMKSGYIGDSTLDGSYTAKFNGSSEIMVYDSRDFLVRRFGSEEKCAFYNDQEKLYFSRGTRLIYFCTDEYLNYFNSSITLDEANSNSGSNTAQAVNNSNAVTSGFIKDDTYASMDITSNSCAASTSVAAAAELQPSVTLSGDQVNRPGALIITADNYVLSDDGKDTSKLTLNAYNKYNQRIEIPEAGVSYYVNGVLVETNDFKYSQTGTYDINARIGEIESNSLKINVVPKYKIELSLNRRAIISDGRDEAIITAVVTDKNGNIIVPEGLRYVISDGEKDYETSNNRFTSTSGRKGYKIFAKLDAYTSEPVYLKAYESLRIELNLDKMEIACNGQDSILFKPIVYGGNNEVITEYDLSISSLRYVINGESKHSSRFSTTIPGDYSVYVQYDKFKSVPINFKVSSNPLAVNPGDDITTYKYFNVMLDGSGSTYAAWSTVTYSWRILKKPLNSAAVIKNATQVNPVFIPDSEGEYIIGLTISDGINISQEKTVKIRAKNFNDTYDDYKGKIISKNELKDCDFSEAVPLTNGWLFTKRANQKKVLFINAHTGEVGREYELAGMPNKLDIDFDNELLVVSISEINKIAVIDPKTGKTNYIDVNGSAKNITMGEKGLLFSLGCSNTIDVVDLKAGKVVSQAAKYDDHLQLYYLAYDKNLNNLIVGDAGTSPSHLGRYSFNETSLELKVVQQLRDLGISGRDLDISSDGKHVVFCCGDSENDGFATYTLNDIDSSDISKKYGSWDMGWGNPSIAACFSLDSKYLIACAEDEINIYSVDNHARIKTLINGYNKRHYSVYISRGGKTIYSLDETGRFYDFDFESGLY